MVELHTITQEVVDNTIGTPEGRIEEWKNGRIEGWITELGSVPYINLISQNVPTFIRSIEQILHTRVVTTDEVVDQSASVASQACGIPHYPFSIKTDNHFLNEKFK